ncbi:unnamed protein product [Ixodes hexagonus]
MIIEETLYWRKKVLERLFAIVEVLASRNLAFRGTSDNLDKNNNKFLGLVELLSKFDGVLQEHVRRGIAKEVLDHYLSKDVQNELIQISSQKVQDGIVYQTFCASIIRLSWTAFEILDGLKK